MKMKAYSIRNGEIFEPEVKEERTNKHRKEKEQECNCNRPYEIELTNEEWLKSLDTEGLVDYLYEVHKGGNSVERQMWIENHKERVKMQFREWLKQPHTVKE